MGIKESHTLSPLRSAREQIDLSTRQIAAAVGISQSQYCRVENGKRKPSPDLANRLAQYFGNAVTRDQILFPEDYMKLWKAS